MENNGILVVVSFHSIEDKIVKNFFKFYSNQEENPSRYLSKKVMVPEEKEIIQNVRSRSAKLRFAVRNDNAFFYSEEIKRKFENYLKTENLKI